MSVSASHADYWARYYRLRREIEEGRSREYAELDRLYQLAKAEAARIRDNWLSLGIKA